MQQGSAADVHQFLGVEPQGPGQSHRHLGNALGVSLKFVLSQVEVAGPTFRVAS